MGDHLDNIQRIKELTTMLNGYRDAYYNESTSLISDSKYDELFDELSRLETDTGFYLGNSPTRTVGYEVKSKLDKVTHNHLMLSLDKTKSVSDIVRFLNGRTGVSMLKMDGLTCSAGYVNNKLISAESRGNGEIGEDILHNARTISNLPHQIVMDKLIVDGEVIITRSNFDKINNELPSTEEKYKNPRNLASGSIRQLDSRIASERYLKFIPWKVISGIESNSFCERLEILQGCGFEIVPFCKINENPTEDEVEIIIGKLKQQAESKGFPIDGIVFGIDDVSYGESLGATRHHLNSQIAYKFYDEEIETTLKDIEWSVGKSGQITPVAIFDTVEIDGTEVSRASLHNVSILKELRLGIGDTITVFKANTIIPQIKENLSKSNTIAIPTICPICGGEVEITKDNESEVLVCTDVDCHGRLLGELSHFASRNAMNIEGMSEATLQFLIDRGWVNTLSDIYNLEQRKYEWSQYAGFGKRSVNKILGAIENSRNTTLERYLYAYSIPLIGRTASKDISNHCKKDFAKFIRIMESGNLSEFLKINGFGRTMCDSLSKWWDVQYMEFLELSNAVVFEMPKTNKISGVTKDLSGLIFVITGSLNTFENRDAAKDEIESKGGKVSGSVSAKTSFLVNNDMTSTSGKNKKAIDLGVKIISEAQLLKIIR